ncbi:lysophospholipid transporter LplT [Chitinimonas sp.]|uniref:lysophospholipid transporter LplT n=1 Tax=Chitinimonas sp. TaxID=1934313 RepID=UPI002F950989
MKRGFHTVMAAQFFSSLADNALFPAAVAWLRLNDAPEWQSAALVPIFALFYVVLAPFLGAFADSLPKGQVMFWSNAIKIIGCLMMLLGVHPLLSFAVVGLGAAAYSPAKYGILTEMLPCSQLVKANGWMEGLTMLSIILGVVLGGQLVGVPISSLLLAIDVPLINTGIDTPPQAAICVLMAVYLLAALFNLRIPRTTAPLQPLTNNLRILVNDFSRCNAKLWADKLGQISLATTTLFWGASANLKYIVLAWAAAVLTFDTTQATTLSGVVAIGLAGGAVLASARTRLDQATRVIPLGIIMGLLVMAMVLVHSVWIAVPFLIILGALAGYLVVPMNALLQHRGHKLMGAGRSIAVQNFFEQASVLGLGGIYVGMTHAGMPVTGTVATFGLLVAATMAAVMAWHSRNTMTHRAELERLYAIARSDKD